MRRRRRWLRIALILVALCAMPLTFGGCADRFLLHPTRHAIDAGRATRRAIDADGKQIEVWTARSPAVTDDEPAAYVLEFCGNATRAEQIAGFVADRWKRHPIEAWVMNYPGFGGSEGSASLASIPPAALATYDELAKLANGRPIFLEANSMGTAAALYVAAKRPVAGLVLQNSPPLRRLIVGRYGWWNLWLAAGPIALTVPAELDALAQGPRVTAPAVFLVAENDALVPPAYQRRVIDAYAGPKQVINMRSTTHWQPVPRDAETQLLAEIDRLWESQRDGAGGATTPPRVAVPAGHER